MEIGCAGGLNFRDAEDLAKDSQIRLEGTPQTFSRNRLFLPFLPFPFSFDDKVSLRGRSAGIRSDPDSFRRPLYSGAYNRGGGVKRDRFRWHKTL